MSKNLAISIENLSKVYRLGEVGTGTLSHDLNRWWSRFRGKEDPYLKIGEENCRDKKGRSDVVYALKDIDLEVRQGEVLGIIGRNGAGKSTLLKILSKVTGPSAGRILTRGRIASLLEVGTGFHPELTGRENIYLNGTIMGMTRREIHGKLDEIVDFAGVERYLDTPVKRYSSGMMVRLGFAVAAHLEPEILVVDEVLAVGDAEFQRKATGKMKEVSEGQGRTVLFVSHNMGAVQNICNRVVRLENGQLVAKESVEEGVRNYLKEVDRPKGILPVLVNRKDRLGTGAMTLVSFRILDANGMEIQEVVSGQSLCFELGVCSNKEVDQVEFVIGITNPDGILVCTLNSHYAKSTVRSEFREGKILCRIPSLPLAVGAYSLSLWCGYGRSTWDQVLCAVDLIVRQGDFFGTGKISGYKQGLLVANNWEEAV